MQRNGSETSSTQGTSPAGTLTSGASLTCEPTISPDTISVISLPASADGPTRFAWPDGPTLDLFGREVVPASRSRSRAHGVALPTSATSGLSGSISSASDALQRSMESRLRARLNGSDLCEVIWKPWATPWGQSLSRPRARVRTTSGIGSGLWPTADTAQGRPASQELVARRKAQGKKTTIRLSAIASWPTPTTRDHKDGSYCPNVPVNGLLGRMVWPTPRANEGTGAKIPPGRQGGMSLKATVATYPTPRVTDAQGSGYMRSNGGPPIPTLSGVTGAASFPGSSAPMEKRGALNPEFVCWLMGYPTEWVSCGVSVTRSTRGRRRSSSARALNDKQRAEK